MNKGDCGTKLLNAALQTALNPTGKSLIYGNTAYRVKDRVIQIRNDYKKGVFNGDVGVIADINEEDKEVTVDFDGNKIVYDLYDLDDLILAYASTIHKSQGSEDKIVVMPVTMSRFIMLQRSLLYTGVTRAKEILILVGDERAVSTAIRNNKVVNRHTKLAGRIGAV